LVIFYELFSKVRTTLLKFISLGLNYLRLCIDCERSRRLKTCIFKFLKGFKILRLFLSLLGFKKSMRFKDCCDLNQLKREKSVVETKFLYIFLIVYCVSQFIKVVFSSTCILQTWFSDLINYRKKENLSPIYKYKIRRVQKHLYSVQGVKLVSEVTLWCCQTLFQMVKGLVDLYPTHMLIFTCCLLGNVR